jgi:hypothetical protein
MPGHTADSLHRERQAMPRAPRTKKVQVTVPPTITAVVEAEAWEEAVRTRVCLGGELRLCVLNWGLCLSHSNRILTQLRTAPALLRYRLPGKRYLKPSFFGERWPTSSPRFRRRPIKSLFQTSCIDGAFKEYSTRGGLENSNENQSMSYDCCGFARNAFIDGRLRSKSLRLRTGYGHRNSARRGPS